MISEDHRKNQTGFTGNENESLMNQPESTFTSRDMAIVAVFGALWGLMEVTLGVTLKGLRIPMGGALLTAIAAVIFLTGRYFVRHRGSILMMGAVAAILKIFSIGTVIAGPFLAILLEALFAEIFISLLGVNRLSYLLTPVFLLIYTIIHPFISQGLLFGDDIYTVYLLTFRKMASVLHIGLEHLVWVALIYAGVHAVLGLISGWIAYALPRKVEQELIRSTDKSGIRS
ncbi:MAG: hypothetical protein EH225_09230 [Calditrichaeota bacterium]|nr:hypothetical protein [Calditrichota bacterium]RQW01783.1 MAG: hypothetical protein EH225_09230 [Calditrichota bacterium]